ncbi:tetratricopeptide repeat protein [Olsenella uli]|uniref:tetratricopeptide repeat protein n=1 Tax=Olsenella uli TaxID=133926 RepID=UPI00195C4F75|nr:tetratricopeptide repeat protein [Olsenella uli]
MNQQAFESGKRAYQEADWLRAVTLLDGAKQPGELAGEVDHLRGNAYMKLGQFDAAAQAYEAALADASYGKRGALSCNRGRALLAAGRPQEAVSALTDAVADSGYATPYKAYMALGSAYEQIGDVRNAGIAYRSAAIDESNPAPALALSDLGSCFMRLGRAVDAVEAYRTALDFTTPLEDQNRIWCDLALAYVAANRMNEAVDAFAHATADGTYELSPEAQASYDAARKAVASIGARQPSETDAFLAAAGYGASYDPLDPTGASGELMPSPEDTGFFSVSEEDLVQQDRMDRKVKRKHRHTGLKVFLVIFLLLALLAGGGAFAYINGYGWPTQQAVAEQLFDAKTQGSDLAAYVVSDLSTAQIQEMSDILPSGAEVSVTGVDRAMMESTVYVTATLSSGGQQDYTIDMTRDGIGWKVSAVTPVYLSQPDGAQDDSNDNADAPADTTTDVVAHDDAVDGAEGTDATSGTDSDSADATISPEEPAAPANADATGSDAAAATE